MAPSKAARSSRWNSKTRCSAAGSRTPTALSNCRWRDKQPARPPSLRAKRSNPCVRAADGLLRRLRLLAMTAQTGYSQKSHVRCAPMPPKPPPADKQELDRELDFELE